MSGQKYEFSSNPHLKLNKRGQLFLTLMELAHSLAFLLNQLQFLYPHPLGARAVNRNSIVLPVSNIGHAQTALVREEGRGETCNVKLRLKLL